MTNEKFNNVKINVSVDNILDMRRVVFKLINKKANQELLRMVPHIDYLDLAIVFYLHITEDDLDGRKGGILIKNDLLEYWKTDVNSLMTAAMENTPKLLGLRIGGIFSTIASYLEDEALVDIAEEEDKTTPLYVATNSDACYGAGVLIYKDMLKTLAERLESDLFIIPCSIHEIIIGKVMEDCDFSFDSIKDMICHVNSTELKAEEILSDSLYYYNRKAGELGIAWSIVKKCRGIFRDILVLICFQFFPKVCGVI